MKVEEDGLNLEGVTDEAIAEAREDLLMPLFISIESPNLDVALSVINTLKVALKYEIEDSKFAIVDPRTCTPLARELVKVLQTVELSGHSRILLEGTLLSEAVNIIRENLMNGVHVITTSFLTEFLCELCRNYDPQDISNIAAGARLFIQKDSEIIIFAPVDAENLGKLELYREILNASLADETQIAKYYAIDTELEEGSMEECVNKVIEIIKSRIDNKKELIKFANQLFGSDNTPLSDMMEDEEVAELRRAEAEELSEDEET